MLSNIAETSTNEESGEGERKIKCERTNCYDKLIKRKIPLQKTKKNSDPQFLNIRNMAPRANLKSKWNKSKNK